MADDYNLEDLLVRRNNVDKENTDFKTDINHEHDEDIKREPFFFSSPNQAEFNEMLLMNPDEPDEPEDRKPTVDLSDLMKVPHSDDVKPEKIDPMMIMHYVIARSDPSGKSIKMWQCGICQKEFSHQYILMRHLPTHTNERKYQCKQCGKAFRQMSTLSQHRAIHSKLRPYICEVCQKTFNRVSTLISHRKTHTGMKPHRCHLCNKAFHQKGNLRNHIFTHTNERPYKCDVCNKGFNQMSNLMCHKFKAHQRADKPKYHCPTCGKLFDRRIALRNHEQYEHGDRNQTVNNFNMPSSCGGSSNPAGKGSNNLIPNVKFTNGVEVARIKTAAMKEATKQGVTPFALLRPLDGVPVLVRVLPSGNKHILVSATADDLKKLVKQVNISDDKESSTCLASIPVVATVIQCIRNGVMCMDIVNPGAQPFDQPNSEDDMSDLFIDDEEEEDEEEEEEDEIEEESCNDEKDMLSSASVYDMYEAANSLMDLRSRPRYVDVNESSVEMFNQQEQELDIDITNSVIDLDKDPDAYDNGYAMRKGQRPYYGFKQEVVKNDDDDDDYDDEIEILRHDIKVEPLD